MVVWHLVLRVSKWLRPLNMWTCCGCGSELIENIAPDGSLLCTWCDRNPVDGP